ncbi:hypothetical protein [Winogradskya humida]|uniref:Uncharacterized protein n=1 Tax=Winogradskya humida TaxID=113566 RepID=A0ABQ4A208_9ACTN|nr:hypothetical protein [Actinoplanes humidus]GIE24890.1 hypothetical protein Ahu01nite_079920 [Actinoplanes humidus]
MPVVAWIAMQASTLPVRRAPTPTPTPAPSGGFDWSKVHPDPAAIGPDADLFYKLANAALFLGIVAALCGLLGGAIAFGVGPIFGAHMISDRGKSMMWKAGLVALVVGSGTSTIAWLLVQ